jgi:phosphopentomutase
MRKDCYRQWRNDECFDVFTYHAAWEHLKTRRPGILYIGLGETDEWGHAENYRAYLDAAHIADQWLREIWNFVQNDPEYRDRTTLFIAADHGRGDRRKDQWTGHGQSVPDSHEIWFCVLGPGIAPRGEIAGGPPITASQFAQTIASLLGFTFVADHHVGGKIALQAR